MDRAEIEALARAAVDAFNRGPEAFAALHAEDVVHTAAREWPESGTYHGREAVKQLWERILGAYEESEVTIEGAIATDDGFLNVLRWRAVGAGSGLAFETPVFMVAMVRDGRIAEVEYFFDRGAATHAASAKLGIQGIA